MSTITLFVVFLIFFVLLLAFLLSLGNIFRKQECKRSAANLVERGESMLLSNHPFLADETLNCIRCVVTSKEYLDLGKFLGARDYDKYRKILYYLKAAEREGADGNPLFSNQELAEAMHRAFEETLSYRKTWKEEFDPVQALMQIVENRQKEMLSKKPEE